MRLLELDADALLAVLPLVPTYGCWRTLGTLWMDAGEEMETERVKAIPSLAAAYARLRAAILRQWAEAIDADAKALHVRCADEAVHIGPLPAAESYLVGAKLSDAAQQPGAESMPPGYGFLAENVQFAHAVLAPALHLVCIFASLDPALPPSGFVTARVRRRH